MIWLIPPYHKGDGSYGATFNIFTTEQVFPPDIIYVQGQALHVSSIEHIDDGDFMEDYYIVDVRFIGTHASSHPDDHFVWKSYTDLSVQRMMSLIEDELKIKGNR